MEGKKGGGEGRIVPFLLFVLQKKKREGGRHHSHLIIDIKHRRDKSISRYSLLIIVFLLR